MHENDSPIKYTLEQYFLDSIKRGFIDLSLRVDCDNDESLVVGYIYPKMGEGTTVDFFVVGNTIGIIGLESNNTIHKFLAKDTQESGS